MNLKEKTCKIEFAILQYEHTRHDKRHGFLTGNLYFEDVLCILCMEMGIAFHLWNATLDSPWFSTTADVFRPRKTEAYFISHHHH